jgi:hypothetical protein
MRGRSGWTVAAIVVGTLVFAGSAEARTFQVTRANDPIPGDCRPNDCSLREAVLAANARLGADRIIVPGTRRDYRLTRSGTGEDAAQDGDLDLIGDGVAVVHRGTGRATISARGLGERIFESFVPTTLKRLVLTRGNATGANDNGGAIEAKADVTISGSVLRQNRADKFGGAVFHNIGTMRILRTKLIGNTALDEAGAIEASGARAVIKRSTIRGNRALANAAGAMYAATELVIAQSTFAGNRAQADAGAVYINSDQATIGGSTFTGNRAVEDGGAITSFGMLGVVNSTFWRNRAGNSGGAIYNGAMASLNAVTVARNVSNSDQMVGGAGGGLNSGGGSFDVANSVVARNDQLDGDADDCAGLFASGGGNLRTNGVDCGGFDQPGDAIRANPKIGRLARNGGPTMTVALKQGSPAIGRGRPSSPARDQRGRRRGSNPDSGAYERGA